MKQRITYLLPQGSDLSVSDLQLENDSLRFAKAHQAAEEWRFTLGMDDLPIELQEVLKDTHELHIRWSAERNARLAEPLVSRLPAGFHAFFTPRDVGKEVPLCDTFAHLLGPGAGKCSSVPESFSKPQIRSGRFATTSTYQYFRHAPIREEIARWLLREPCQPSLKRGETNRVCSENFYAMIREATYVDLDFDAIGHALVLIIVWNPPKIHGEGKGELEGPWISKLRKEDRVEVGTLQAESSTEMEELSLGGFLTVLGEDEKPSATMFSFPSRHHPLPAGSRSIFKASFELPSGLHPKFDITLPRRYLTPPKSSCALHAYFTLPSSVFIDRYQFLDPLFLASQNLVALRSLSGEDDLEAPDWVLSRWGSAALFELASPNATERDKGGEWTVTVPTHLRYLAGPQLETDPPDQATVEVPWPAIFWACEAEEGLKMSNNPFDRINLGYDGLFGPKTMFYHVPPSQDVERLVAEVKVPVLDPDSAGFVRLGTAVAVMLGFLWICWKMVEGLRRGQRNSAKAGKKAQ